MIVSATLAERLKKVIRYSSKGDKMARKQNQRSQLRLVWLFGAIFTANIVTWLPALCAFIEGAVMGLANVHHLSFTITYDLTTSSAANPPVVLSPPVPGEWSPPSDPPMAKTLIHPIIEVCFIREINTTISKCFSSLKKLC